VKDFALKNGIDPEEIFPFLPILKYYNVFNGKDIEILILILDNFAKLIIDKELPPATQRCQFLRAPLKTIQRTSTKIKTLGSILSNRIGFYKISIW
jgi:hypothetical protein